MSAPTRAQRAARLLAASRSGGTRPGALPDELAPRSAREAYDIQAELAQQLGARIGGWKASMSDPATGLAAPVYTSQIHDSPARLEMPGADGVGIEPEIAFALARDLDPLPGGAPYDLAALEPAIAAVHPVIEIVHSRFADRKAAPLLDRLADNLSNAGLVRGAACAGWRALRLGALPLRIELRRADGRAAIHESRGGAPLGDPLLPLLWLVNDAIDRGSPLRRGALVTTGSCAGLHPVERGTQISVAFGGLGGVQLAMG